MVTMLSDMKDFLLLTFKMFCFPNLSSFCWLNKVSSLNMFEFMCDPLHGLARQLRYECQRKHAWSETH